MNKPVERILNPRPLGADYKDDPVFNTLKEVAKQVLKEMQEDRLKEVKTSFDLPSHRAPQLGERLLLLILSKDARVNIPGDLEEEFKQIAAKHGARFAKLWYYKQVAASAWPLIRKAIGLGLLAWMEEWIRRRV